MSNTRSKSAAIEQHIATNLDQAYALVKRAINAEHNFQVHHANKQWHIAVVVPPAEPALKDIEAAAVAEPEPA